jgi:hypothetical protein
MIRRWRVEPDMEVDTPEGTVLAVSREALVMAAADAVVMCDRAGGVFSMVLDRFPTGLPGEMITTGAIVEWKHRTDARPEAEVQRGQVIPASAPDPSLDAQVAEAERREDDPTQYKGGEFVDDIGDGLDPNALPEEDDSEVTEPVS